MEQRKFLPGVYCVVTPIGRTVRSGPFRQRTFTFLPLLMDFSDVSGRKDGAYSLICGRLGWLVGCMYVPWCALTLLSWELRKWKLNKSSFFWCWKGGGNSDVFQCWCWHQDKGLLFVLYVPELKSHKRDVPQGYVNAVYCWLLWRICLAGFVEFKYFEWTRVRWDICFAWFESTHEKPCATYHNCLLMFIIFDAFML